MLNTKSISSFREEALSILRAVTALLYMQHGVQKLFGWPAGGHHVGAVKLLSMPGAAGLLEFFGGILLLLGLATRQVAFVLAGEMAFAYWYLHFPSGLTMANGWMPVVNQGDLAIQFCFVFLYFFVAGPGKWSLDRWFKMKSVSIM